MQSFQQSCSTYSTNKHVSVLIVVSMVYTKLKPSLHIHPHPFSASQSLFNTVEALRERAAAAAGGGFVICEFAVCT